VVSGHDDLRQPGSKACYQLCPRRSSSVRAGSPHLRWRPADLITVTHKDGSTSVASFVDRTTVVLDASKHPNERRLREVLGSGVPLRGSEALLAMYDRLEHDAALWFVLNGNGTVGDGFAALGLRPQGYLRNRPRGRAPVFLRHPLDVPELK